MQATAEMKLIKIFTNIHPQDFFLIKPPEKQYKLYDLDLLYFHYCCLLRVGLRVFE